MNILGVGGPELIIILVIMLVVAGPKRMIQWAYVLGQYIAKFRRMWAETVDVLQHEFDEAGVDVKIPREMPTRGSINRQASNLLSPLTDPMKDTMKQVDGEIKQIGKATAASASSVSTVARASNGHTAARTKPAAPRSSSAAKTGDGFGSWSDQESKPGFGSWSVNGESQDDEEK
ncbi:MAG: hypothetical protein CL610_19515 [Anaerolineaceae bacterium]|nr:hypothetical protein [Anaerolineaceae bacterium]